jgi:hypothetical protein
MRSWIPAGVLSLVALWNTVSYAGEAEDPAERVGYHAPDGAKRVGKATPSQTGDEVAFFESRGESVELVVAVRGGAVARWPVTREHSHLEIFWTGPSELILGTAPLAPRVRVKWTVSRAGGGTSRQ